MKKRKRTQKKVKVQESQTKKSNVLEQINLNTAGIDVGSRSVFACISLSDGTQEVYKDEVEYKSLPPIHRN